MDRYSKIVLTVIAVALSVIALQNSGFVPAWAQQARLTQVEICGYYYQDSPNTSVGCVSISRDKLKVTADPAL
ncbi:MAG: hypothetical protein ACLPKB_24505 [Xanthobacteraceae bacterium]